ncbi:MAG: LysE family translocator, partial [Armatimonadetes bacterium]|nr:LysE family translocator [Armatimonadota bacterium]
ESRNHPGLMAHAEAKSPGGKLPTHRTLPVIFGIALVTGFSGAIVPGSLLAVVVRETVRVGWAAGPVMMIGHGLLELVAIVLLITGLIRFARSPGARGVIGVVGAVVLLYLGYQTLLIPGEEGAQTVAAAAGDSGGSVTWLRLIWLGALMSMANPYWWLWWATIGVAHVAWAVQRGRLGGATYFTGHVLSDVVWYSALSLALGAGRTLLSPAVMRGIYVACAVFLVGLGVVFAVAGLRSLRTQGDLRAQAEARNG